MLIHEEKNPPGWRVYRVKKDQIGVCVLGELVTPMLAMDSKEHK
ncbi:hypothetical protein O23A_p2210 [Aeromonas salmonicida]|nr:hypothetical protein O23A_p2210 [Aeromonas salmonicida]